MWGLLEFFRNKILVALGVGNLSNQSKMGRYSTIHGVVRSNEGLIRES